MRGNNQKKFRMIRPFLGLLIVGTMISCSKEEPSVNQSFTSQSNTTSTTQTWVKLTAVTTDDVVQPGYIVMMFDEPVTEDAPLPPIITQVTTDEDGLAHFNLNSIVTSSTLKTYYFEAFVDQGEDYVWKSISHPVHELNKGKMVTSSILVNP